MQGSTMRVCMELQPNNSGSEDFGSGFTGAPMKSDVLPFLLIDSFPWRFLTCLYFENSASVRVLEMQPMFTCATWAEYGLQCVLVPLL